MGKVALYFDVVARFDVPPGDAGALETRMRGCEKAAGKALAGAWSDAGHWYIKFQTQIEDEASDMGRKLIGLSSVTAVVASYERHEDDEVEKGSFDLFSRDYFAEGRTVPQAQPEQELIVPGEEDQ